MTMIQKDPFGHEIDRGDIVVVWRRHSPSVGTVISVRALIVIEWHDEEGRTDRQPPIGTSRPDRLVVVKKHEGDLEWPI